MNTLTHSLCREFAYLIEPRLLSRVVCNLETGCWEWTGSMTDDGYGKFNLPRPMLVQRRHPAHRISYLTFVGDLDGLLACHRCDNRKCIRPDHLWKGTVAENQTDMVKKGRQEVGSMRYCAKLTESDIPIIRRLLADGHPTTRIGALFGVDGSKISQIRRGIAWKHV